MNINDSFIEAQLLVVQGQAEIATSVARAMSALGRRMADLLVRHSHTDPVA